MLYSTKDEDIAFGAGITFGPAALLAPQLPTHSLGEPCMWSTGTTAPCSLPGQAVHVVQVRRRQGLRPWLLRLVWLSTGCYSHRGKESKYERFLSLTVTISDRLIIYILCIYLTFDILNIFPILKKTEFGYQIRKSILVFF